MGSVVKMNREIAKAQKSIGLPTQLEAELAKIGKQITALTNGLAAWGISPAPADDEQDARIAEIHEKVQKYEAQRQKNAGDLFQPARDRQFAKQIRSELAQVRGEWFS